MAPGSVIGAAAPIVLSPGGEGVEKVPDTAEKKMTSAVRAIVRTSAEKNGYNIAVVEAMIDKTKGLTIDGQVIAKEGEILTLTNTEAGKEYGHPPKPLLSSGTVESLDMLLEELGYGEATRHYINPTGAEKLATWLNLISPILLLIGVLGIYLEFKMPGVALPGIIGVIAFALYFFGGYIAGLSGMEWMVVFIIGLALVVVEIFVYPGTLAIGLLGVGLMLVALIMAMVDIYPGMPSMPTLPQLRLPIQNILYAMAGGAVAIALLSRILPKTPVYRKIVSQSASGVKTELVVEKQKASLHGRIGVAISPLRPGGKAQFGDEVIDVISQGDLVEAGAKVRIISYSGTEAVVEVVS
jgi:membrane-bound serine protease (ClpP class)